MFLLLLYCLCLFFQYFSIGVLVIFIILVITRKDTICFLSFSQILQFFEMLEAWTIKKLLLIAILQILVEILWLFDRPIQELTDLALIYLSAFFPYLSFFLFVDKNLHRNYIKRVNCGL
jgi:hypothetical protein